MREIRITSNNKEYDALLWLIGADHYFIYHPLVEALRKLADYLENKDY